MEPKNIEHTPDSGTIDDLRVDASIIYYEKIMNERIKGPQLEGYTPEWLRDALCDPTTRKIDLGDGVDWPILARIAHNQDYRADFFSDHFPDHPAYFFSLPPNDGVSHIEILTKARAALESVRTEGGIITYDNYISVTDDTSEDPVAIFLTEVLSGSDIVLNDVTPESQAYGQSYGSPKVSHFEAVASQSGRWELGDCNTSQAFSRLLDRGEYVFSPEAGPTVLTQADLQADDSKLLDDIWEIYSAQFDELVDDHPSLQVQPRKELESMLLDDESFNVAYMEDGKIAALCYFVSNIEKCVWLNPAFYSNMASTTPGIKLAYFPGIVVDKDKARQGGGYVDGMIKLIEDVYEEAGTLGMQIVFQCTNVSETYIPKIVTGVISQNGVFEFGQMADEQASSFRETATYNYHAFQVQ